MEAKPDYVIEAMMDLHTVVCRLVGKLEGMKKPWSPAEEMNYYKLLGSKERVEENLLVMCPELELMGTNLETKNTIL